VRDTVAVISDYPLTGMRSSDLTRKHNLRIFKMETRAGGGPATGHWQPATDREVAGG